MTKKEKMQVIQAAFEALYPDADCTLTYQDPLQLLIATQLAAQCTDARVNIVTRDLYQKYTSVHDFAAADLAELEQDIKSTGFYHNKAKNIIGCCQKLMRDFGGVVPKTMEELLTLPGVGRKTANLVLGDIFGVPGIVVDTHAKRITKRLGLTKQDDPAKVEQDLLKIVPKAYQTKFCHQLVLFGRDICIARRPQCGRCPLEAICPAKSV